MTARRSVRFAAAAQSDLTDIWNYIAEHSEAGADRLIRHLLQRCQRLGRWPHTGRPMPELGTGVRGYGAKNYIILYRVRRRTIEVLHIFNGARDLPAAMRG